MSFSRAHPSLRTRIVGDHSWIAIPVNRTADKRAADASFTERYRGTEFETHYQGPVTSQPSVSRGRMLVLVSVSALSTVAAGALLVALG